tara:strand:- start:248 stop:487 length:240 start_codon:yes stop_codon:yes gene_type:complete
MTLLPRDTKADKENTTAAMWRTVQAERKSPGLEPVKADALRPTDSGTSKISDPATANLGIQMTADRDPENSSSHSPNQR